MPTNATMGPKATIRELTESEKYIRRLNDLNDQIQRQAQIVADAERAAGAVLPIDIDRNTEMTKAKFREIDKLRALEKSYAETVHSHKIAVEKAAREEERHALKNKIRP